MRKVGRNEQCPCGSGSKFKKCCEGKQDWQHILSLPYSQQLRHLSLRGKNLVFFHKLFSLLQIDKWDNTKSFADIKHAFTPQVIQGVHEFIVDLWPDNEDFERCVSQEREDVTALYTGIYEPKEIFEALTRHALYSNRIFLLDPFWHPCRVREDLNPLNHPEIHKVTTIKFVFLWLSLFPWIEQGIVNFVRAPTDFNPSLFKQILDIQRDRFDRYPELQELSQRQNQERFSELLDRGLLEYVLLSHSDDALRAKYRATQDQAPFSNEEEFLAFIHERRENHPYFVEPEDPQKGEFLQETSGANYELAKHLCSLTNSHLITNLSSRWKELQIDREEGNVELSDWTPFAKALQNADLRVLKNVTLDAALKLRKEQRLEQLRWFFRRVWKQTREPDEYSSANALNLAAELDEKIREAKTEWKQIDQDLVKWLGISGAGAGMLSATAATGFVPAAGVTVASGVTNLIIAQMKRINFREKYPAGFFLSVEP